MDVSQPLMKIPLEPSLREELGNVNGARQTMLNVNDLCIVWKRFITFHRQLASSS